MWIKHCTVAIVPQCWPTNNTVNAVLRVNRAWVGKVGPVLLPSSRIVGRTITTAKIGLYVSSWCVSSSEKWSGYITMLSVSSWRAMKQCGTIRNIKGVSRIVSEITWIKCIVTLWNVNWQLNLSKLMNVRVSYLHFYN